MALGLPSMGFDPRQRRRQYYTFTSGELCAWRVRQGLPPTRPRFNNSIGRHRTRQRVQLEALDIMPSTPRYKLLFRRRAMRRRQHRLHGSSQGNGWNFLGLIVIIR
jgi:hypothetical protein